MARWGTSQEYLYRFPSMVEPCEPADDVAHAGVFPGLGEGAMASCRQHRILSAPHTGRGRFLCIRPLPGAEN